MPDEIKPIKRSNELSPLSRDHHEGLLLGWKIRQGLKNGTTHEAIGNYVQWFWKFHLDKHFNDEEKLLAPLLPGDNTLIQQMFNEHTVLRNMVNENRWDEASLSSFASLLNDHIRFEERVLFPLIEQLATKDQLESVASQLAEGSHDAGTWSDEFWLRK